MEINHVESDRLRQLADFLMTEELKEVFYMIEPFRPIDKEIVIKRSNLPAIDAAISESVRVFPADWVWDEENEIGYYKEDPHKDPCSSAMMYYGLVDESFKHLFVPFNQHPEIYGGTMMEIIITPTHIGENIYAYLRKLQANLN